MFPNRDDIENTFKDFSESTFQELPVAKIYRLKWFIFD